MKVGRASAHTAFGALNTISAKFEQEFDATRAKLPLAQ